MGIFKTHTRETHASQDTFSREIIWLSSLSTGGIEESCPTKEIKLETKLRLLPDQNKLCLMHIANILEQQINN